MFLSVAAAATAAAIVVALAAAATAAAHAAADAVAAPTEEDDDQNDEPDGAVVAGIAEHECSFLRAYWIDPQRPARRTAANVNGPQAARRSCHPMPWAKTA